MDPLDRIGMRSAEALQAEATMIADTEAGLRDVREGVHVVPLHAVDARRRTGWWMAGAAAAIVGLLVGVAVLAGDGDDRGVVPATTDSVPTDPIPTVTTITIPATPVPTSVATPDTSASPSTAPASTATPSTEATTTTSLLPGPPLELRQGLSIDGVGRTAQSVRHVDTYAPSGSDRTLADYVAILTLPSGHVLQVGVGAQPWWLRGASVADVPTGDGTTVQVLQLVSDYGDIAAGAGRLVNGSTWVWVASMRSEFDPTTGGWIGPTLALDVITAELLAVSYDQGLDRRASATAAYNAFPAAPTCTSAPSVSGGAPDVDLVLFLCDGTFAVFDGATGELEERILTLGDRRVPLESEEAFYSYVDGIAISPDGSTVWFSTGPEPAAGNLLRWVRGSGDQPEQFGSAYAPAINPAGDTLAAGTALDAIVLIDVDDPTQWQQIPLYGMYPRGGFAWSPDGTRLAFEVGGGLIATYDLATGDTVIHGHTGAGEMYLQPNYRFDGGLEAMLVCCDGVAGSAVEFAVVGGPGNELNLEVGGEEGTVLPWRRFVSGAGTVILADDVARVSGVEVATGVLFAAVTSDRDVDAVADSAP
jgi:hypothetical protein